MPPDDHVHSQWSWDTAGASMEETCDAAIRLGIPSITFTEHLDFTRWHMAADIVAALPAALAPMIDGDGQLCPPLLDVDGYLACVEECRDRFPALRIRSGLEVGEPHWHDRSVRRALDGRRFDRVLGSMHTLVDDGKCHLVTDLVGRCDPTALMRRYLAETLAMVESSDGFDVLAHIDYPVRRWPPAAGAFDPSSFEDEFRAVLRALAGSGRALEISSVVPLAPSVVRWWCEEGGDAVTFGSDSHSAPTLGRGFDTVADLAGAVGFRPGSEPDDLWRRRRAL